MNLAIKYKNIQAIDQRYLAIWSMMLVLLLTGCSGQRNNTTDPVKPQEENGLVGGGCDGCELMFVDMPNDISASDTSAGWYEEGEKLLVTGIVYHRDGKTPMENVIIYYWQTDNNGYYSPNQHTAEKARRHGHIRGWMKTGSDGQYSLYTIRPVAYPDNTIPAHIHISIKEPSISNEYYIDEFVFDDDPLLSKEKRKGLENRGGSGILYISMAEGMQKAHHDIILGLNIPGYSLH